MSESLRSVADLIADRPDFDSGPIFDALWQVTLELRARIDERFELHDDPGVAEFHRYGGDVGPRGSLHGYAGPEVDWMIHSWVGNPEATFTNMHLTLWLGAQVDVPHLGIAFGTLPDPWLMIDFPPRRDTSVNPDYLDRYYDGEPNEKWLRYKAREDLTYFTSRAVEVRSALSPNGYVYLMKRDLSSVDIVRELVHEELTRWFTWLDEAVPVPEDERAALAERDLLYRRTIAERDPANIVVINALGQEMADGLISALWGGKRTLPRAGQTPPTTEA